MVKKTRKECKCVYVSIWSRRYGKDTGKRVIMNVLIGEWN